jgi:hypothetical protein
MLSSRYYHVTDRVSAHQILEEGFQGGWGDVGLGVYVYASRSEAEAYANKGGWDGGLKDPVILLIEDNTLEKVIPLPEWPSKKYENMYWKDFETDALGENAFWKPDLLSLVDDFSATFKTPARRRPHL